MPKPLLPLLLLFIPAVAFAQESYFVKTTGEIVFISSAAITNETLKYTDNANKSRKIHQSDVYPYARRLRRYLAAVKKIFSNVR